MTNQTFINTSDKYGDRVTVTLQDYLDLNPEGSFEQRTNGIYEDGELIAEVVEDADEPAAEATVLGKHIAATVTTISDTRFLAEIRVNGIVVDGWDNAYPTREEAEAALDDLLAEYMEACAAE